MVEWAADIHDRLTRSDPAAFSVDQVDLDLEPALPRNSFKPLHRQSGGRNHRPAHEDGVSHPLVAEPAYCGLGPQEVGVGPAGDVGDRRKEVLRLAVFLAVQGLALLLAHFRVWFSIRSLGRSGPAIPVLLQTVPLQTFGD